MCSCAARKAQARRQRCESLCRPVCGFCALNVVRLWNVLTLGRPQLSCCTRSHLNRCERLCVTPWLRVLEQIYKLRVVFIIRIMSGGIDHNSVYACSCADELTFVTCGKMLSAVLTGNNCAALIICHAFRSAPWPHVNSNGRFGTSA